MKIRSLCRFLFSTLLSVYNKWMFTEEHFGFPAPLFVSSMHMAVQFSLAALMRHIWPKHFKPPHNPSREDYAYVESFRAWTALKCVQQKGAPDRCQYGPRYRPF